MWAKTEHENGGQLYLHVCEYCFSKGKAHPHPSKGCRQKVPKKRVGHCRYAVPASTSKKSLSTSIVVNSKKYFA